MLRADSPPLGPTGAQARRELARELSRAVYHQQQAPLDRLIDAVRRFLQHLLAHANGTLPPVLLVVLVLAAAVVLALTVPHLRRAARTPGQGSHPGPLDEPELTADGLRARALAAQRRGDWSAAHLDWVRAIARGGQERMLLDAGPGSTAHEISARLAVAFPAEAGALRQAADGFDAIRYGGGRGDPDTAGRARELDDRLRHARPAVAP